LKNKGRDITDDKDLCQLDPFDRRVPLAVGNNDDTSEDYVNACRE
jgi:hypothetical protein